MGIECKTQVWTCMTIVGFLCLAAATTVSSSAVNFQLCLAGGGVVEYNSCTRPGLRFYGIPRQNCLLPFFLFVNLKFGNRRLKKTMSNK